MVLSGWKDEETETPVVLGVVVMGCRNVVSGVSWCVSGVDIRHYSACALCMMPIILKAKLHAAFRIFLQSKKLSSRLTKYTMVQYAGE